MANFSINISGIGNEMGAEVAPEVTEVTEEGPGLDVCLASHPSALPFALAPLHHNSAECSGANPCLLAQNPPQNPQSPRQNPRGESEEEEGQNGEGKGDKKGLKLVLFDGFFACESPRNTTPRLGAKGAHPGTFLQTFGDESPPPADSASSSTASVRARGGPANMVSRGWFRGGAKGTQIDMARLIEVYGQDVIESLDQTALEIMARVQEMTDSTILGSRHSEPLMITEGHENNEEDPQKRSRGSSSSCSDAPPLKRAEGEFEDQMDKDAPPHLPAFCCCCATGAQRCD